MAEQQTSPRAETGFIEQKITQRVTISNGATDTVTVTIPAQAKAFLKGYGYTWFTSNTYKLNAGTLSFPSRSDQEGSTSIPVIYGNPYPVTSGNISLQITNDDSASHTYDVVFYVLCNRIIPINSTGGELILATGSGGTSGAVTIYDSTVTTAANVTSKGLAVDPQAPAALVTGTKTTSGATAEVLASSTAIKEVTIQVDVASGDDVLIGNATTQVVRLVPTQSITLRVDNLNDIYIKRPSSTNVTVNYIGA